MLFNSLTFIYFFLIVYAIYLVLEHKWQNHLLLAASYFFYGTWDPRFLLLLFLSTLIDYFCARSISTSTSQRHKKALLILSLTTNLGILGFFKYFNFFADSLTDFLNLFGMNPGIITLEIILPVGISFYTFQTMSYSIDVYLGKLKPCRSFASFALYVSFFPQLIAGPIERAGSLIPQIENERSISAIQIREGIHLFIWGLYKKIFIADNLAIIVDASFQNYSSLNALETWLAAYAFAFQLYCDFSGYSNMARGISKMMGFELMVNFRVPFFAVSLLDFWKRWHISLTTWLRDYVYTPHYFKKKNLYMTTLLVFLLNGLWHGADWNFILMGVYWGTTVSVATWLELRRRRSGDSGRLPVFLLIAITFHLNCIGFVFFRAESIPQLVTMLSHLFTGGLEFTQPFLINAGLLLFFCCILIVIDSIQWKTDDLMIVTKTSSTKQLVFYAVIFYQVLGSYIFRSDAVRVGEPFIYFQF